ncbi:LamG domain-containing protein [Candidatus Poribacteria bacterium]|nr:LamG domain-containing protein [Candidatus Poribacteria bacterium]
MKKHLILLIITVIPVLFSNKLSQAGIVTDGLVSYWTFDRANIVNKTAKDVWGENNGKIVGNPKIVPGKIGEALEFDGNGDFVNLTTLGDFGEKFGQSTFEAWFKTSNKTDWMNLINTNGHQCPYWGIQFNGFKNRFEFEFNEGMIHFFLSLRNEAGTGCTTFGGGSTYFLNDGEWHHIAYIVDINLDDASGQRYIYIDNKPPGISNMSFGHDRDFFPFSDPVYLGARNHKNIAQGFFEGMIDEGRFYDRPLTEEEVQQNFESTHPYKVEPKGKLSTVWGEIKIQ